MLTLIVTYHCKEGKRADFYNALCELGIRSTSLSEAGCLQYDYFFAAENETDLLLVEQWEDRAAQGVHCTTETFAKLQTLKPLYCESTDLKAIDH